MHPFLQIDGDTEIVHSDMLPNGEVKVYIEKPDEKDCFHHMICYLPDYEVDDVYGFSKEEVEKYIDIVRSSPPKG